MYYIIKYEYNTNIVCVGLSPDPVFGWVISSRPERTANAQWEVPKPNLNGGSANPDASCLFVCFNGCPGETNQDCNPWEESVP